MKTLEEGQQKIKKIGDKLRYDVLQPAQEEAKKIIEEGRKKAEELILQAEAEIEKKKEAGRLAIEQEHNVFISSLEQASKQSLETLRQEIEKKFFNEQLQKMLEQELVNPQVISNLINALVDSLKREGLDANLEVIIPKAVSPREVNQFLIEDFLHKLKGESVTVGNFSGGIRLKVIDKKMTLEISDTVIKDMLVNYIRKDFRKLVFGK